MLRERRNTKGDSQDALRRLMANRNWVLLEKIDISKIEL
jgi:hypothetical protein